MTLNDSTSGSVFACIAQPQAQPLPTSLHARELLRVLDGMAAAGIFVTPGS